MISLIEAFNLLEIEDGECVFLTPLGKSMWCETIMTGREVRNKLDMKKVKVRHIGIRIDRYDGEFFGYALEVTGF